MGRASRAELLETEKVEVQEKGQLQEAIGRAVNFNLTDAAILGMGFFLGYQMNMRPGIDVPIVGFLGFPDFGGAVKTLRSRTEVLGRQLETAIRSDAVLLEHWENRKTLALEHCEEIRRFIVQAGGSFDVQKCYETAVRAPPPTPQAPRLEEELARVKADLRNHRLSQGFLMAILIYMVTRPGFVQGVGELVPG